jgi:Tol biopolymer transport system component
MGVQNAVQSEGPVVGAQLVLGINGDVAYQGASGSCSASSPTISLYDLEVLCTLGTIDPGTQVGLDVSIVPQSPGAVTAVADLVLPVGVQDPSPNNAFGPIGTTVVAPASAPTGTLLFQSDRNVGAGELLARDLSGPSVVRLNPGECCTAGAAWSPDGSQIAYFRFGLTILEADGSSFVRHAMPDWISVARDPRWSPDGGSVVFEFFHDFDGEDLELARYDFATDTWTRLTNNTMEDATPDWSPDGSKVVFSRDESSIRTINPDGSGDAELFGGGGAMVLQPRWSPSGDRMAYARQAGSTYEVVVRTLASGAEESLVGDALENQRPVWSPDGLFVAFSRLNGDGWNDIWVAPADGGDTSALLEGEPDFDDTHPDWK